MSNEQQPKITVLRGDDADRMMASMRPTNEREKKLRRAAQDRLRAGEAAKRDDRALNEQLEEMTERRDRALEVIRLYEAAMDVALADLDSDAPAARALRTARMEARSAGRR